MFYGSFSRGRKGRVSCMIYSDDKHKIYWDIFIAVLLITVCIIIPFRLAFIEDYNYNWEVAYYVFDLFFLFDMVLTFNTTFTEDR